ncbi:hypothetical protein GCM10011390_48200 [Aureimonas endophytica]|uniref:Uncharacterized protein n=1 Tax=Aureimonas endophytica TaxID=2027858 RepID=A0A917A2D3_9HYPH|nr:hypothetical protein [Aureimonas endophytica]GGE23137.1 hypothetical protein GCM10011390_48200 [Aureimonas endophytica]
MTISTEEEQAIASLARSIVRDREAARELSMPFACRLLDLCLMEVALNWEGRGPSAARAPNDPLAALLETKLRVALAEHGNFPPR